MLSFAQDLLKSGAGGMFRLLSAAKRLYAPTVTSVCPIPKPLLSVTTWGPDGPLPCFSSASHSLSLGEQPIWNAPGGIQTYFSPSLAFSRACTLLVAGVWASRSTLAGLRFLLVWFRDRAVSASISTQAMPQSRLQQRRGGSRPRLGFYFRFSLRRLYRHPAVWPPSFPSSGLPCLPYAPLPPSGVLPRSHALCARLSPIPSPRGRRRVTPIAFARSLSARTRRS